MAYVDDLLLPQISSGDAQRAVGITAPTFKNWSSRKPSVILLTDREKVEIGDRVFFNLTLLSVYHLAIVGEFVSLGLTPRKAHLLASALTMRRDGHRQPGMVFPGGYTYIVGAGNHAFVERGDSNSSVVGICNRALRAAGRGAVVILNATQTIWRTRTALGLEKLTPEERL